MFSSRILYITIEHFITSKRTWLFLFKRLGLFPGSGVDRINWLHTAVIRESELNQNIDSSVNRNVAHDFLLHFWNCWHLPVSGCLLCRLTLWDNHHLPSSRLEAQDLFSIFWDECMDIVWLDIHFHYNSSDLWHIYDTLCNTHPLRLISSRYAGLKNAYPIHS